MDSSDCPQHTGSATSDQTDALPAVACHQEPPLHTGPVAFLILWWPGPAPGPWRPRSEGGRLSGNIGADAQENEARPDSITSLLLDCKMGPHLTRVV